MKHQQAMLSTIPEAGATVKTVLIVDDEPVHLSSLKIGLRSKGYDVITASNGSAARSVFHNHRDMIDLVITDFTMPGMNGLELLRTIKNGHPFLPIIIMTGCDFKNTLVSEVNRNHCSGFLAKPFTLEALLREIERVEQSSGANSKHKPFLNVLPRLVHQINNPMQLIMGHAELALDRLEDREFVANSLKSILKAAGDIETLNRTVMGLGRMGESQKATKVNMVDVIERAFAMYRGLMAKRGIRLETAYEQENLPVYGSEVCLEEAFKSLIMNALDAMSSSPQRILKVAVQTKAGKAAVLIRVEDTGCEIAEDVLPEIFTPYFTSKKNGNGLGLAIVKETIENHQGCIQVESRVGKGTAFIIELPVGEDNVQGGNGEMSRGKGWVLSSTTSGVAR